MDTPPPIAPPPPIAALPANPVKADSNDKLLIILCHLSLFLGVGLLLPLIIYLVKKGESEKIAAHARESLNFHISLVIYAFASVFLCAIFIGFPLLFGTMIIGIIFPIIAAVKASEGSFYHYPLCLRLVS